MDVLRDMGEFILAVLIFIPTVIIFGMAYIGLAMIIGVLKIFGRLEE